jgi:hypothetical protein
LLFYNFSYFVYMLLILFLSVSIRQRSFQVKPDSG